jgi:hypothetical protein
MKKLISVLFVPVLALSIVACGSGSGSKSQSGSATTEKSDDASASADKKLPFKQGSYVQTSKAMGFETKQTVYFDKWGDWTATENKSEMKIAGMEIKTDKIEIVKGKTHWDIDLIKKTGTQYEGFELPAAAAAAIGAAFAGQMADGMEIEELGEEVYLGYTCKKTRTKYKDMDMDVTTLTYGKMTMKTEGNMGGLEILSFISDISESAPPASKFEVPAGIEIEKQ